MSTDQTGPIAVYGATGFTGRLVTAELTRRGADFVLAGRSRERLDALAAEFGGAETRAVSVEDHQGLRDLLEPCSAVIACAGPFVRNGEPVVAAAAATGTNYVDTTGEQPFMRTVFDRYGPQAERSGATLVPAMGFDYVPGDMIASLTAGEGGPFDDVTLAYCVLGMQPTRGTTRSALDMLAGGDFDFTGGELRPADRKISRGTFTFPEPAGEQRMTRYPAGEPITVPRHVDTRQVTMMLNATAVAPPRAVPFLGATMPAFALAMRTPLHKLADRAIGRLPEGPGDATRASNTWTIVCEATPAQGAKRRGVVSGPDVYGLTAKTTVEGALRLSAPDYERPGALAPSEAFDPADFLGALAGAGVTHSVEERPVEVPA